jgi:hypothetical protein
MMDYPTCSSTFFTMIMWWFLHLMGFEKLFTIAMLILFNFLVAVHAYTESSMYNYPTTSSTLFTIIMWFFFQLMGFEFFFTIAVLIMFNFLVALQAYTESSSSASLSTSSTSMYNNCNHNNVQVPDPINV